MRIHIYQRRTSGGGVSPHIMAARDGFIRHGLKPSLVPVGRASPCDLAVCWGVKKKAEMASGRRALVLERGYVGDRLGVWTSMGFDGLNGRADFRNAGKDSTRWDRLLSQHMDAWFAGGGDYVLVMGQVPGDAAVAGMNIDRWAVSTMRNLQGRGIPARYRPHPLAPKSARIDMLHVAQGPLDACLRDAMWVVTYNSNSGVDAVLAGVPTVALDPGSMVWAVSGRWPTDRPPTPDRERWAAEIAWCQWTLDEIRAGDAWDHLRGGVAV